MYNYKYKLPVQTFETTNRQGIAGACTEHPGNARGNAVWFLEGCKLIISVAPMTD